MPETLQKQHHVWKHTIHENNAPDTAKLVYTYVQLYSNNLLTHKLLPALVTTSN